MDSGGDDIEEDEGRSERTDQLGFSKRLERLWGEGAELEMRLLDDAHA